MAVSHEVLEPQAPIIITPVPMPVVVVAPQLCAPYAVALTVTKKVMSLHGNDFTITDPNDAVVLQVKGKGMMRHHRCVLLGANEQPILSFRGTMLTMHNKWEVFRGDSKSPSDLLFTARCPKLMQLLKTEMDIFLAGNNTDQQFCDFRLKGNYFDRNCAIYLGDSDIMIAQITRKYTAANVLLGRDTFNVTVFPNVDHVFVAALVVLLDEVHSKHRRHRQHFVAGLVTKGLLFL
ncbi:hypothetical protein HU200_015769 [Digitaria exilis]|uniref:Uncharacterized protein n=1 Tax=Digitaria exilis TaxID=1010633 RepID=A0A835F8T9_9POAL|nr:hypothetical protein HU200_015769 [Digitaria exilis]CAB3452419.1 unnamed protein product [Digitaria exilis]CAB3456128.1 unnamed protein product [Digitaria exilis]CAB3503296.1 unnamed protein product [Digitaria exilis]